MWAAVSLSAAVDLCDNLDAAAADSFVSRNAVFAAFKEFRDHTDSTRSAAVYTHSKKISDSHSTSANQQRQREKVGEKATAAGRFFVQIIMGGEGKELVLGVVGVGRSQLAFFFFTLPAFVFGSCEE